MKSSGRACVLATEAAVVRLKVSVLEKDSWLVTYAWAGNQGDDIQANVVAIQDGPWYTRIGRQR